MSRRDLQALAAEAAQREAARDQADRLRKEAAAIERAQADIDRFRRWFALHFGETAADTIGITFEPIHGTSGRIVGVYRLAGEVRFICPVQHYWYLGGRLGEQEHGLICYTRAEGVKHEDDSVLQARYDALVLKLARSFDSHE